MVGEIARYAGPYLCFIRECARRVVATAIAILRSHEDRVDLQSRQACLRMWDTVKFNSKKNGYNITKYASEIESCKQEYKRNDLSLSEPELQLYC